MEKKSILDKHFTNETEEQQCIIGSDLMNGGKVAVSEADLEQARKVLREFKRQSRKDYQKLYLRCDKLLLACLLEEFRQFSHQTFRKTTGA